MENQTTEPEKMLVIYSAEWCKPCKELKAEIDKLNVGNKVKVIVVDIEKANPEDINIKHLKDASVVPRVCFIKKGDKMCDGIADCEEGDSTHMRERIKKFMEE